MINGLAILVAICANVLSSLLLKKVALLSRDGVEGVMNVKSALMTFSALALLGVTFSAYTYLLRSWPVSLTYALVTFTTQICLVVFGAIIFGERLSITMAIGLAFIGLGLAFLLSAGRA